MDPGSVPQNSPDPSQPLVRQTGVHLAGKETSSQREDLVEISTIGSRERKEPRALDLHSEGPGVIASALRRTPRTPLCRHPAGPGLGAPSVSPSLSSSSTFYSTRGERTKVVP